LSACDSTERRSKLTDWSELRRLDATPVCWDCTAQSISLPPTSAELRSSRAFLVRATPIAVGFDVIFVIDVILKRWEENLKNVKNAFFIPKIKKNVCKRDKKTLPYFLLAFDVTGY